jgi:hypothetical protein
MIRVFYGVTIFLVLQSLPVQKEGILKANESAGDNHTDSVKSSRVVSGPLSFGNGDFFMISSTGETLKLEHRQDSVTRQWEVTPTSAKGKLNSHSFFEGKISQLAIARWSKTSMIAVVKTVSNNSAKFWAISFPKFSEKCFEEQYFSPKCHFLCEVAIEHDILAVSGTVNSPAYTILVGAISSEAPSKIETGTIFFEPCGFIDEASGSSFRIEAKTDEKGTTEPQQRNESQ